MQVLITPLSNGAFGEIHLYAAAGFVVTHPSPAGVKPKQPERIKYSSLWIHLNP